MKKANLILITSIFLFIFINVSLAQATVTAKVVYYDSNCPRSKAHIWILDEYGEPGIYFGYTNEYGVATKNLADGDYWLIAEYPAGNRFVDDTFLRVQSGSGTTTLKHWQDLYPNGTEPCGDSECDGYQYCYFGNPPYIQCNSTNTDCGTCCKCNGGTQWNPSKNYDSSQNGDCPLCQECSALDTCSNAQSGTDPKDECRGNDITGIATCDNIPDDYHFTWDFRNVFTSYCNGAGSCTTGDSTITHTCNQPTCGATCDKPSDCSSGVCKSDCTCLDTTPPVITLINPINTIYHGNTIYVKSNFNEPISWAGYSLDGKANVTLWTNKPAGTYYEYVYASTGSHNVVVYANDSSGNMGKSTKVYFTTTPGGGGKGSMIT